MDRRACFLFKVVLVLVFWDARLVSGQSVTPSNDSLSLKDSTAIQLAFQSSLATRWDLLALIPAASSLQGTQSLPGKLTPTDVNSSASITQTDIAFIQCDPTAYAGYIGAVETIAKVVNRQASAVVLWSNTSAFCKYYPGLDIPAGYSYLYSMTSLQQTRSLLNALNMVADPGAYISKRSTFDNSTQGGLNTGSNGGNGSQQPQPGGPSPSTAVAMIILYSITGVITALFLVIIITGAIRAHRHPERYGPRNVLGRTRQSRARGLARAMLDTLPIVKFGEKEGDEENATTNKPSDVELASTAASADVAPQMSATQNHNLPVAAKVTGASSDGAAGSTDSHTSGDLNRTMAIAAGEGIGSSSSAPATTATATSTRDHLPSPEPTPSTEEALGCSICTEDFEKGQDVRILPCKHSFHPTCIDPWLLNVSGTCPLCRIDLRPATSDRMDPEQLDEPGLPPPLEEQDVSNPRSSRRLSSFLEILNPHRMQEASPQERIAALRRVRDQRRATANEEAEARRRRRVTLRLQDAFSIRTRQRGVTESPERGTTSNSNNQSNNNPSNQASGASRGPTTE